MVAICLDTTPLSIISIFAIWKISASFVPINIYESRERLNEIIIDSNPKIVISENIFKEKFFQIKKPLLLIEENDFDTNTFTRPKEDDSNKNFPTSSGHIDSIAYIIYTSGSTGRPKGVMITHRNLSNYLFWAKYFYQASETTSSLLHSAITFDLTLTSLFLPLISGGTVVFIRQKKNSIPLILAFEQKLHFNFLKLTPSHLFILNKYFASIPSSNQAKQISTMIVGGENLYASTVNEWMHNAKQNTYLYNEYGPTEATIGCSVFKTKDLVVIGNTVSIGNSIDGTFLYVLNKNMSIVPEDVPGELYISGECISIGYLNKPDLTAEKFLPNPFSKKMGSRLYKSGDIVIRKKDGSIYFIRRKDQEVKIRGYRVNLAEIEIAIAKNISIETVIVWLENTQEYVYSNEIHAAIVFKNTAINANAISMDQLKKDLHEYLPDYMVPSTIHVLKEVITNYHGKPDKKLTIQNIKNIYNKNKQEYLANSDEVLFVEGILNNIWKKTLNIDSEINERKSFFEYGGNSILMIKMHYDILNLINIEIPIHSIFEIKTLSDLKQKVSQYIKKDLDKFEIYKNHDSSDLPFTSMQKGMFFLQQIPEYSNAYNIPIQIEIKGSVDIKLLKKSFLNLIERHEILKSYYKIDSGFFKAITEKETDIDILEIDYSSFDKKIQNELVLEFLAKFSLIKFNLTTYPLFRICLIKISSSNFILLVVINHIIFDGWSLGIFLRDLSEFYKYYSKDINELALPDLKINYFDYVYSYNKWVYSQLNSIENKYIDVLRQSHSLSLNEKKHPIRKNAITSTNNKASHIFFRLSGIRDDTSSFCLKNDITQFMLHFITYTLTLHTITNENEMYTAVPTANRLHPSSLDLIGCFINVVVIESNINNTAYLLEYLKNVKENILLAYKHQYIPFEHILSHTNNIYKDGYDSIFKRMFVYQNTPFHKISFSNLEISVKEFFPPALKYEISFLVKEDENDFSCVIEYTKDVYNSYIMDEFEETYRYILNSILTNSQHKILDIKNHLLKNRVLVYDKYFKKQDITNANIVRLLSSKIEEFANKTAVIDDHNALTYKELDEKSSSLAMCILDRYKKNIHVAVHLKKSSNIIIALFAIWKSNAVYIPIDLKNPSDRKRYIINNSNANLIITTSDIDNSFTNAVPILYLDKTNFETRLNKAIIANTIQNQIAYIIYTSGTTGHPKGVAITHHNLINHMLWIQSLLKIDSQDNILQRTNIGFDASIWEMVLPFMDGATLVVPSEYLENNLSSFIDYIKKKHISVLQIVPTLLSALDAELHEEELDQLKILCIGGEQLNTNLINRIKPKLRNVKIVNLYGPTECTIDTIAEFGVDEHVYQTNQIPVGYPVWNTNVYILNKNLDLMPKGSVGEVFIAGECVGLGYISAPSLTAEKFLPNPFSKVAGSVLYRTNDLGRLSEDGKIEILGRVGNQIKIRGYRVELEEIEMVLKTISIVSDVAVIFDGEENINKKIIAFIILQNKTTKNEEIIRDGIRNKLPDYMIPSLFLFVEKFPRTISGKIDKKLLLESKDLYSNVIINISTKELYLESPDEKLLVSICRKLLNNNIGANDNFFSSGGDSILALQFVTQAKKESLFFSIKDIFTYQTIRELVTSVKLHKEYDQIQTHHQHDNIFVPLTPIQNNFFETRLSLNYNKDLQSVLLSTTISKSFDFWVDIIYKLLDRHDVFFYRFLFQNGDWWQYKVDINKTLFINKIFLGEDGEDKIYDSISNILEEKTEEFNIETKPLIKFVIIHLPKIDKWKILIIAHHLIVDYVSWNMIIDEIVYIVEKTLNNSDIQSHFLSSQYDIWSVYIKQYLQKIDAKKECLFWENLYTNPETIRINANNINNKLNNTYDFETYTFSKDNTLMLHKLSKCYHFTLEEFLIVLVSISIAKAFNVDHVKLDIENNGRSKIYEGIDISSTIGWFTAIYPIIIENAISNSKKIASDFLKNIKNIFYKIKTRKIDYLFLRSYIESNADQGSAHKIFRDKSQISFNYFGELRQTTNHSGVFDTIENIEIKKLEKVDSSYILEFLAYIFKEELSIKVQYTTNTISKYLIKELLSNFESSLAVFADYYENVGILGALPSDFSLVKLSENELNNIIEQYKYIADILPLSPLQQGFLFHSIYSKDAKNSDIYIELSCLKMDGELSIELFKQAWFHTLIKHPVLRAKYHWNALVEPIQIILSEENIDMDWLIVNKQYIDTQEEKDRYISNLIEEETKTVFNLSTDSLMRWRLVSFSNVETYFIWIFHHILLDGWSIPILLTDVWNYYDALLYNYKIQKEVLNHYPNYLQWLSKQDFSKSGEFWKKELFGIDSNFKILDPYKDIKNTTKINHASSKITQHLDNGIYKNLIEYSKNIQITLNTICLSLWSYILYKYSNEPEFVIGITTSGRNIDVSGIESFVGLFINTLPLKISINKNYLMIDFFKIIQNKIVDIQCYEYNSLIEIQNYSNIKRGASLFDIVYVFESYPMNDITLSKDANLNIKKVNGEEKIHYPLGLSVFPESDTLKFKCIYDSNLYSDLFISNILKQYTFILSQIVYDHSLKIKDITLVNSSEIKNILALSSGEKKHKTNIHLLHQLFELEVAHSSENIALIFSDKKITYNILNMRSNKLARYIASFNFNMASVVAVFLERSIDSIVSMLAILKLGFTYLPIEPGYPKERLAYILTDSNAKAIITIEDHISKLPDFSAKIITLDGDDLNRIGFFAENNLDIDMESDIPAYIIYTSGSTGRPKGVLVSHENIVFHMNWLKEKFPLDRDDIVLQKTQHTFDASFCELFSSLISGATLLIAKPNGHIDYKYLAELIYQERVSIIFIVSSAILFLLDELKQYPKTHIRKIFCGGELLTESIAIECIRYLNAEIIHLYGPTETTIDATYYIYNSNNKTNSIPIGYPIDNANVYILDSSFNILPFGIKGEIFVSGKGLSYGYIRKPDTTASKFLPDPFSLEHGTRMYRTGDYGLLNTDGSIEFLGRMDFQVKLRGYRIETGEVERILNHHPAVKESVVLLQEDLHGEKQLIAYLASYLVNDLSLYQQKDQSYEVIDRRSEVRVPLNIECMAKYEKDPNSVIIIYNLSSDGVGLSSIPQNWKRGGNVVLNLILPGSFEKTVLSGYIVWKSKLMCGLKLTVPDETKKLISQSIAYVIQSENLSVRHLRSFLQERLPAHMIPSVYVLMDNLPITTNGKINRSALTLNDKSRVELSDKLIYPRDWIEVRLKAIWETLFSTKPIGIKHNFFDLGGHSITAIKLVNEVMENFNTPVSLPAFFREPTIEYLAGIIRSNLYKSKERSPVVLIKEGVYKVKFYFIHPVGGNILCYLDLAESFPDGISVYALEWLKLPSKYKISANTFSNRINFYLDSIVDTMGDSEIVIGGWSLGGIYAIEIAKELQKRNIACNGVVLIDTMNPENYYIDELSDEYFKSWFVKDLASILNINLDKNLLDFHYENNVDILEIVLNYAQKNDVFPQGVDYKVILNLYNIFKENVASIQTHVFSKIDVNGVLFYTDQEDQIHLEQKVSTPQTLKRWSSIIPNLQTELLFGDHYNIMKKPAIYKIIEKIIAKFCDTTEKY